MFTRYPHIFAIGVIFLGSIFIFLTQPKREDCAISVENFRSRHQLDLYSQPQKNLALPPRLRGALDNCRSGNNSGACLDAGQILLSLVQTLNTADTKCLHQIAAENPVRGALLAGMGLYIQIAWGEKPPDRRGQIAEGTWLEFSDLALFCRLKTQFVQLYGQEALKASELAFLANLVGDEPIMQEEECLNCAQRKSAIETLGFEEARRRSLLALNCARF